MDKDDDDIYDEIDRFNMEKDAIHEKKAFKRKRPVEVLSVNVDDEEEGGNVSDDVASMDSEGAKEPDLSTSTLFKKVILSIRANS